MQTRKLTDFETHQFINQEGRSSSMFSLITAVDGLAGRAGPEICMDVSMPTAGGPTIPHAAIKFRMILGSRLGQSS